MLSAANPVSRSILEQAIVRVQLLTNEGVGLRHMIRKLDNTIWHYTKDCKSARTKSIIWNRLYLWPGGSKHLPKVNDSYSFTRGSKYYLRYRSAS